MLHITWNLKNCKLPPLLASRTLFAFLCYYEIQDILHRENCQYRLDLQGSLQLDIQQLLPYPLSLMRNPTSPEVVYSATQRARIKKFKA